jgi:hypothetical protein
MAVFGLFTPVCALLIDRRGAPRCRSPPHCVHRRGRAATSFFAGTKELDMTSSVLLRVGGHCSYVGGDAEVWGRAKLLALA